MTKFVIRSMSTTDYVRAYPGRPEQKPVPYHIYLRRPENRTTAWWSSIYEAQRFDSFEAAKAELVRTGLDQRLGGAPEIVPENYDGPTYWERQALRAQARARLESLKPYVRKSHNRPGRAYPLLRTR